MENIIQRNVMELYKDHGLVYGTEVNRRRMLPDVRDGLKLVQRRDIYVMTINTKYSPILKTKSCSW